jgi:hypothetical protein
MRPFSRLRLWHFVIRAEQLRGEYEKRGGGPAGLSASHGGEDGLQVLDVEAF